MLSKQFREALEDAMIRYTNKQLTTAVGASAAQIAGFAHALGDKSSSTRARTAVNLLHGMAGNRA